MTKEQEQPLAYWLQNGTIALNRDGTYSRVLFEVAISCGNFRITLNAKNWQSLFSREMQSKAVIRIKEWLERVIKPDIELRERWRLEDETEAAFVSAGDVPMEAA